MPDDGVWDDYLFKGAAPFYQPGRLPYAAGLVEALPNGTPGHEEKFLDAAGYFGFRRLIVDDPGLLFRTVETLVAEVYSKSSSAQHLFGDRLDEFDARLRDILRAGSVDGGYLVA
jgi:hypothetical protein